MSYSVSRLGTDDRIEEPRFVIWHTDHRFGFDGSAPNVLEDDSHGAVSLDELCNYLVGEYYDRDLTDLESDDTRVHIFDRTTGEHLVFSYSWAYEQWDDAQTLESETPDIPLLDSS